MKAAAGRWALPPRCVCNVVDEVALCREAISAAVATVTAFTFTFTLSFAFGGFAFALAGLAFALAGLAFAFVAFTLFLAFGLALSLAFVFAFIAAVATAFALGLAFGFAFATAVAAVVLAFAAAMVVFGLFVAMTGRDAFEMYGLIYVGAFSDAFAWQNTLQRAAPLILTALAHQSLRRPRAQTEGAH